MDRSWITKLCGLIAALIGGVVLLGWVLRSPVLIQIFSSLVGMVINTAACLFLAGLCLLLPKSLPWVAWWRLACGALLSLVGTLVLFENLLDVQLGIDWTGVHNWLNDSNPRPGRMAPNTSTALIAIGVALLLTQQHRPRMLLWRRLFIFTTIAFGLSGLFGYFLKIELWYGTQSITRMALHTAVGITLIGLGLWFELYETTKRSETTEEGRSILPITAGSMAVMVIIASVTVFTFMQNRMEQMTAEHLLRLHNDRSQFFSNVIENSTDEIVSIATRPNALARMRKLYSTPGDATARAGLEDVARSFLPHGYTWIGFYQRGRITITAGQQPARAKLTVSLPGPHARQLLWRDGYFLQARVVMRDQDGVVGEIVAEQPLKALTKLTADTNLGGETLEMLVCTNGEKEFRCFPGRFHAEPFTIAPIVRGKSVPMVGALERKIGKVSAFDFRNQAVLAAYGPVGDLGIGMVIKMDWAELYAPLRERFLIMLFSLATVVALSLLLLQRRLRPLVRQLIESKRTAQASEARFLAAAETSPDGFYILDSVRDQSGKISDFTFSYVNDSGAKLISPLPRHRLLKQRIGELFPLIRSSGHLNKYKLVVEIGTPLREEFQLTAPGAAASWVLQQVVRLGDGVAITARDISESKNIEKRLTYMAQNDPLTGLPNRVLFNDRLEQAFKRAIRHRMKIALFYLDIDHFKKINDTLGHAAGDELLRSVSDRLRCCVRSSDTVARLGGDEFTIILEELRSTELAATIATKIIEAFLAPIVLDGTPVTITISIGIAHYDAEIDETFMPNNLIQKADKALYEAKRHGRGRYRLYAPGMEKVQNVVETD